VGMNRLVLGAVVGKDALNFREMADRQNVPDQDSQPNRSLERIALDRGFDMGVERGDNCQRQGEEERQGTRNRERDENPGWRAIEQSALGGSRPRGPALDRWRADRR